MNELAAGRDACDVVCVAVAAVVENMSTVAQPVPPATNVAAWGTADPEHVRVLITRRRAEQVLGDYWELPGGKLEADESPEQAVVRELREEVGIEVRPIAPLPCVEHAYEHATVRLLPFVCRRVQGVARPIDVAAVRWVAPGELGAYHFPAASLPVIDALLAGLGVSVGRSADGGA